MSSNRLLSVLFLIANLFAFTNTQFADSAQCSYFNETFSGSSGNTWTPANGTWSVQNGVLNVSQIPSGKMASYQTTFYPFDYFAIDADIETVSLSQGGAYGLYPYTSGSKYFEANGKTLTGIGVIIFDSGNAYLTGWDVVGNKWYNFAKYITTAPVTSIGVAYSSDAVTLRINKQDTTSKISGNFTDSWHLVDELWLMAQGTDAHIRFDNICADPLVAAPPPVPQPQPMPMPTSQEVFVYLAVETPLSNTIPSLATPIGVGTVANKGDTYSLKVDTGQFESPVDLYLVYLYPEKDNILYCIDSNNNPTQAIVPWRTGVTSATESLFGDVDVSLWPRGAYYVALLAMPSGGDWSSYYFWVTAFEVVREFQYGTPTTHNISGTTDTSIYDPISGNTFRFPNGGNGTLTITPITAVPDDGPVSGSSFEVEYSGTDSMQLLIPHNADEVPLLWLWGDPEVSIYESPAPTETWLPLPNRDNSSNPVVFDLSVSVNAAMSLSEQRRLPAMPRKLQIFWTKLKKNDWFLTRSNQLLALAQQDIQKIVDILPAEKQQNAVSEINVRLNAFMFPNAVQFSRISSYHPFSHLTGKADPYFVFVVSDYLYGAATTKFTVAHEVGHYMSHVLLGDDVMRILVTQAIRNHGKGTPLAGRPMLEEYAYFSDYCINYENNCTNDAANSIGDNIANYSAFFNGHTPKTVDWPSKEGYATSLLAKMHTKNAEQYSHTGGIETIPLIKASLTELWGILAKGPITVNALYLNIVDYLNKNSDKLAPLLERSGWSYNGGGFIRTGHYGNDIKGAIVHAVAKVSSEDKEYIEPPLDTLASVVTDNYGYFTLPRIFPGHNFIRVWLSKEAKEKGEKGLDFPVYVSPFKPTNETLPLGEFIVPDVIITSVSPATGPVGTAVTITGTGFGVMQGTVTFNGTAATASSWGDTQITTTVPTGATTGNVVVTNHVTAVASNGMTFTVTYTVTASAGTGGSISPLSATVNSGETTSFTVTPNTGYSLSSVTGCSGTLTGNTYTTGPITANCTVSASFNSNTDTGTTSATMEQPGYWAHLSYTISGPQLNAPTGNLATYHSSKVETQNYTGKLAGTTLTVSGTAVSDNESSGAGSGDYYIISVSVTAGTNTKTFEYIAPKGEKLNKPFSVSVPVDSTATSGSFSINLFEKNANWGTYGYAVSGSLTK